MLNFKRDKTIIYCKFEEC